MTAAKTKVSMVPRQARKAIVRVADDRDASVTAEEVDSGYGQIARRRERDFSRETLSPTANSAKTIRKVMEQQRGYLPDLTLEALTEELAVQCAAVSIGNLEGPEAMLMSQAQTLDAVFQHVAQLAYDKMPQLDVAERLLRLAFRAQNQCRATIETLALTKNPPSATFVKQANVANGPQQINNNNPARPREQESGQNELLEKADGKRLESKSSRSSGSCNSQLAAVGEIDRTGDRGR